MSAEMKYNGQRIFNGTAGPPPMSHPLPQNASKAFSTVSTVTGLPPSSSSSSVHPLSVMGGGPSSASSSVHHQLHHSTHHFSMPPSNQGPLSKGLYRMNSALDLDHNEFDNGMRREFGSVSSIDALGNNPDASFYSFLKQLKRDQQQGGVTLQKMTQSTAFSVHSNSTAGYAASVGSASGTTRTNGDLQSYASGLSGSSLALDGEGSIASPRVRKRLTKLWETKADKSKSKNSSNSSCLPSGPNGNGGPTSKDSCDSSLSTKAIFRKISRLASTKAHQSTDRSDDINGEEPSSASMRGGSLSASTQRLDDPEVRFEEKLRRKAFAHYDCQSLTANLSTASRLCHLLAKRRNTTTGASAASISSKLGASNSTVLADGEAAPIDAGDERSNDLLLSCPFFRNELGGEEERQVALSRFTADRSGRGSQPVIHRPHMAAGLALLEDANERRWKLKCCPYQRAFWPVAGGGAAGTAGTMGAYGLSQAATAQLERSFTIEHCDIGATYYRQHFYGLEHQNWFGIDEHLGPVAISIRRERVPIEYGETGFPNASTNAGNGQNNGNSSNANSVQTSLTKNQYRLIIRTSELSVLRGAVHEDALPFLHNYSQGRHSSNQHSNHHAKEVLEYVAPELGLSSLRLGVSSADEQLLKLDEQLLTRTYKVGVLYCKAGQKSEEEMYNNELGGPTLDAFLDCIGQRVRLAGFDKYRAGLDNKSDTTGTHSLYATFADAEVMFHVSTLLPYTPNNRQQLLRKRHIGNDIVTIVFQEPDAPPFTPKCIRSHFQHVFIVVRQLPNNGTGAIRYAVAVSRSKDVPVFGPPIPVSGQFTRGKAFAQFLLAKIINAENAAHRSEKFRQMAQRTRHEYLKELASSHCTSTTLQEISGSGGSAGAKLVSSIFGGGRKNRSSRPGRDCQFVGHSAIKGAICWEMCVEDFGQSRLIDCVVAVSCDTLLLLEQQNKQVVFVCGCQSILGWSSHPNWIKIFFHQGECVLIKCKDPDLDEISELVNRLRAVTNGCETQEIILQRNSIGQLGFHVGYDGIVNHVEQFAYAWQVGLRRGARIVEICKVAIATLSYEQMLDLLKTSITVSVTVLAPLSEGFPRRGCNLPNCSYVTNPLANSTNSSCGSDYENIGGVFDKVLRNNHFGPQPKSSTSSAPVCGIVSSSPISSGSASKSLPVSPEQSCKLPPSALHPSTSAYSNLALSNRSVHNGSPFSGPSFKNNAVSSIGNSGTYPGSSAINTGFNTTSSLPANKEVSNNKLHGLSLSTGSSSSNISGNQLLAAAQLGSAIAAPSGYAYTALSRSKTMLANNGKPNSALTVAGNRSPYLKGAGSAMLAASNLAASIHEGLHCIGQQQNLSTNSKISSSGQTSALSQPPKNQNSKATSDYNSDTSSSNEWNSNSWSLPPMDANKLSSISTNICVPASNNSNTVRSYSGAIGSILSDNQSKSNTPYSSQTNTLDSGRKSSFSTTSSTRSTSTNNTTLRNGFARLKSSHPNAVGSSCCSSSTSTLQEDLLRLINPDYVPGDKADNELNRAVSGSDSSHDNGISGSDSAAQSIAGANSVECSSSTQYSTPYSSLERGFSCGKLDTADEGSSSPTQTLNGQLSSVHSSPIKSQIVGVQSGHPGGTQVILTVAQPAQVVAESVNKLEPTFSTSKNQKSIEEREDAEWRSLVEKTQKTMKDVSSSDEKTSGTDSVALNFTSRLNSVSGGNGGADSLDNWIREFENFSKQTAGNNSAAGSSLDPESVKSLEDQLKRLQIDLVKEQSDKLTLEEQVKRLRMENARLQSESHIHLEQLRKFTEWFFANINAK